MLLEDFCKKIDAVPMSVIEDIKAEIPILSHWQTDDGQDFSDRNLRMWHDIFKAESEDKE